MKIGIVGSRTRDCEEEVRELVRTLPTDSIVVSGGARGVDTFAENEARRRGLLVEIHRPQPKARGYGYFCQAARERNRKIAESVDILLYAFVSANRKGGTEQTVKFAKKRGVKVILL